MRRGPQPPSPSGSSRASTNSTDDALATAGVCQQRNSCSAFPSPAWHHKQQQQQHAPHGRRVEGGCRSSRRITINNTSSSRSTRGGGK